MFAFRLPVSQMDLILRHPTGAEDVLLAEAGTLNIRTALLLLGAIGRDGEGGPVAWSSLPVSDLDAALLRLRQFLAGDWIKTTARCTQEACGSRIDLSFRISEFLEHQQPELRRDIEPAGHAGWFRLKGAEGEFRLPSCGDVAAVSANPGGYRELVQRCVKPEGMEEAARLRLEEAMEAMAPSLYTELEGECPECGQAVSVPFDPQVYVLRELRSRAMSIYEEIDLLAARYHWTEQEILAMPRVRRSRYAELSAERREG